MIDNSGRVEFSLDRPNSYHVNPEHKHYVNEIVDELNSRENGFFIGPFRELEYPLRGGNEDRLEGYDAFEEKTIEGEFDVMAITNNRLIYYEVKTGDRSIHGSRRQFKKALNFAGYNNFGLDFNVLATSLDFENAADFLDSQDTHFTREEFDSEVGRNNRVDLYELKKSGIVTDIDSLYPCFRIDPREPDLVPIKELVENGYVERDGHFLIPREKMDELREDEETHYLITSHYDNFYSREDIERMIDESLGTTLPEKHIF